MMAGLVCVKTFATRAEAEMARGLLESSGIHGMIRAEDLGRLNPRILVGTGGIRLLVPEDQAQEAAAVLASAASPDWDRIDEDE